MRRVLSLVLLPFLLFYAIPVGAAEKEERTLEDEIIYSIMIDRFFDGNPENNGDADVTNPNMFNSGDFAGVTKKLDYLKEMGFTTILLSPVFMNDKEGYHGYWVEDFYKTDPHFGTLDELKTLVQEAHSRDIKVMVDFVANSVGPNHPWLQDPTKEDWFHEKDSADEQLEKSWIDSLPDLNHENPEAKAYLLDAAKWWIEETNIDGYRLHQAEYVNQDFWKDFVQVVKSEKADFYLIGDVLEGTSKTISSYEETGIDAFMDYTENEALRQAFAAPDESLTNLFSVKRKNEDLLQADTQLVNFMDTSQSPRFTFDAANHNQHPGTRWKMALAYLYTTPSVPVIFYGSEIALNGNEAPENHQLMNFKTEQDLVDYITDLAKIRAEHPALSRGKLEVLYEKDGVVVYKRTLAEETNVVVINNTSKTQKIVLNQSQLEDNKELRGLLNGDLVRSQDGTYSIVIDREQAEVYKLVHKSVINIPYFAVLFAVLALFALFIALVMKRSKRNSID